MASLCVHTVQCHMLIIFISSTSLMSQLHLVLSDPGAAYCTEMELGEAHFTPQSFGKTMGYPLVASRLRRPAATHCGFFRNMEQGWVWPGSQYGLDYWAVDKLVQSVELSLQAARRGSAGLLWLLCTPAGSPCIGERSPARPLQSGPGRWRESCRGPVWHHTAAESSPHPGWSGDCCQWTARTSGETPGWRWPWSPLLVGSRLPPLIGCYHARL